MNSMEFNKIAGATIGALLLFLLLNFFSELIYGTREAPHVVDEDHGPVLAYAVPVEAGEGAEPEEEVVDLHAVLASADPGAGESAFRACGACHAVEEGVNKVGPWLFDVVGRDIASVDGFAYSDAMAAQEGSWTPERLFHFLDDPRGYVPGTKMSFAGVDDPQANANIIAYLNELGGTPVDLTEGIEPLAPASAAEAAPAAEGTEVAQGAEGATPTGEPVEGTRPGAEQGDVPAGGTPPVVTPESATETTTSSLVGEDDPEVTAIETVDVGKENVEVESTTPLQIEETDPPTLDEAVTDPVDRAVVGAEPAEGEAGQQPATEGEAAAPGTDAAAPAQETETQVAAAPAGDAAAGERLFRRCQACHTLEEGTNRVGPSLHGVVGREIATVEGFSYSDAMAAHDGVWTPEALSAFLEDPKAAIPGNRMAFAGLRDEQDRIDLITYLQEAAR